MSKHRREVVVDGECRVARDYGRERQQKHERLGKSLAEYADSLTPGERRRWLARQRRRRR